MPSSATYVYGVVAAARRPTVTRRKGLPDAGPVRLLEVQDRLYLAAADVPLAKYSQAAIEPRLSDLEWVSRAAIAHEAIVESFDAADAVLPMKLFTLFNDDQRALAHVRADLPRIVALV